MIIYFTGTGNSRYAAELLAADTGDELKGINTQIKHGETGNFQSEKPYVFVCPTHGWRIPRIFEDWIQKSRFGGSRMAYFILTCGTEVGDAVRYVRKLCREKNFDFMGLKEVVMPENYVCMFPVPDDIEAKRIRDKAEPVLHSAARAIRKNDPIPCKPVSRLDRVYSRLVNPVFRHALITSRPFWVTEDCISCGRCEKVCPVNGIRMEGGYPVWTGPCVHCQACICGCPRQAIEYGMASEGKSRYLCPHYEGGQQKKNRSLREKQNGGEPHS
jgi:ferredoxin